MNLNWQYKVDEHYSTIKNHFLYNTTNKKYIWVTMLYGSQNYGLDNQNSDVDTKTMLLPSLASIATNEKAVSKELTMPDGSLDTSKDVRLMFDNYLKGNINFIETLYTDYYVCNGCMIDFYQDLRANRNLISNARPVKLVHMAAGMAEQKFIAFDKFFKGKEEILTKYGYDPKQLHHLYRLNEFISTYLQYADFASALFSCSEKISKDKFQFIMSLKNNPLQLEEAEKLRQDLIKNIRSMTDLAVKKLPADNGYDTAKEYLGDLAYRIIKNSFKKNLNDRRNNI